MSCLEILDPIELHRRATINEIIRYYSTIVDHLKKAQAQKVVGHEIHVEEELLVTETCDCSRVDYLRFFSPNSLRTRGPRTKGSYTDVWQYKESKLLKKSA